MKRYSFYLPLLLAVALAGCKDPTKDSVTSGSTIGNTTISDSTYTNSGDFIEQWDAYTSGEMKVITLTWSSSSVSIDGLSRLMALMKTKRLVSSVRDNSFSRGRVRST